MKEWFLESYLYYQPKKLQLLIKISVGKFKLIYRMRLVVAVKHFSSDNICILKYWTSHLQILSLKETLTEQLNFYVKLRNFSSWCFALGTLHR